MVELVEFPMATEGLGGRGLGARERKRFRPVL